MRVAHCVGWYFPDCVGGSEVYVQNLCAHLGRLGVECVVMAPAVPGSPARNEHQGVTVVRYPATDTRAFSLLLSELMPDALHLHSYTLGAGPPQLEAARALGIATLTTVHVPAPVCPRGTLLYMGRQACDGRLEVRRCAACWARAQGASWPVAEALARIPVVASERVPRRTLGRAGTALRASALMSWHAHSLQSLAEGSDRMVAVARFLYDALRANGIAESKLRLCRQGVDPQPRAHTVTTSVVPSASRPLRACFLGRWDPVKGADVVVRAVAAMPPNISIELSLHGVGDDAEARAYRTRVERSAAEDPRIHLLGPVPPDGVLSVLASYDVAVVPSLWLETGPLVAMEALVAGVPVLGSDQGGLRELIVHGQNGWLVKAGSVPAWRRALVRLVREGIPAHMDRSGSSVQSMAAVALAMQQLYAEVVQ